MDFLALTSRNKLNQVHRGIRLAEQVQTYHHDLVDLVIYEQADQAGGCWHWNRWVHPDSLGPLGLR